MVCETDRQDDTPDHATAESANAQSEGAGASGISLDQFWARLDPIDA